MSFLAGDTTIQCTLKKYSKWSHAATTSNQRSCSAVKRDFNVRPCSNWCEGGGNGIFPSDQLLTVGQLLLAKLFTMDYKSAALPMCKGNVFGSNSSISAAISQHGTTDSWEADSQHESEFLSYLELN